MKASGLAAFLAVAAITCLTEASAQEAYLQDTRGAVVRIAAGPCVRTGYWSPATAIADCDPDLVPKPEPKPAPVAPRPATPVAPPPPKPAAAAPAAPKRCDAAVTLQGDELFASNQAGLSAAAKTRLEKDVLGKLLGCASVEAVIIEAHTDRLGSQEYNQKLSERRAESVKQYLVTRGVDPAKVETLGMGKTVPAKFCPDAKDRKALIACLAPNRRAIVTIRGTAK